MRVIGLTGGIASGKTLVSDAFAALGVPIIDTDVIARDLVKPGRPALAEIVRRFGSDCLQADGSLNRRLLRDRVFADASTRRRLEAILHPRIRTTVRQQLHQLHAAPYAIVVIPLLAESSDYLTLLDRVLVVDVPESVQCERVMARDGIDAGQAERILAAQANRKARLACADDILDNTGTPADLAARVSELDQSYRIPEPER